jgi:hypothetical protein
MHVSQMIETSPNESLFATDSLTACIEACFDCSQTCIACADACLGEEEIDMLRRCIRLDQDCADICLATGRVLSRRQHVEPELVRAQLEACLLACQLGEAECSRHASHHEHCRVCAEACRACARACEVVISATIEIS